MKNKKLILGILGVSVIFIIGIILCVQLHKNSDGVIINKVSSEFQDVNVRDITKSKESLEEDRNPIDEIRINLNGDNNTGKQEALEILVPDTK